jgi:hypothetical protein
LKSKEGEKGGRSVVTGGQIVGARRGRTRRRRRRTKRGEE